MATSTIKYNTHTPQIYTINIAGNASVNVYHDGFVLIASDRGGLYSEGNTLRQLTTLVASTALDVVRVDRNNLTVTNLNSYGTLLFIISDKYCNIT